MILLLAGCVDFNAQLARQTEQQANAVARWDLYLNSRLDDLYARMAVIEAMTPGCHLRR